MSFLKGSRESPGMVVTTGEHPRSGRGMVTGNARNDVKDLIYGEMAGAPRPPLAQAVVSVDPSTGAPVAMFKSKVGPGRQRRPPSEMEVEQRRQYEDQAAQSFQEARQARQGARENSGRVAVSGGAGGAPLPPGGAGQMGYHRSRSDGGAMEGNETSYARRPSPSREGAAKPVDPELAEMLRGIERTAEAERSFWDAQAVAEKGRARNRSSAGVFGGEEVADRAPVVPPMRQQAMPVRPQSHDVNPAVQATEEARAVRERAQMRNRGGGIFASAAPLPPPPPRELGPSIIG